MFISFEGIDACGKSTQIKRVADNIVQNWHKETVLTREPGGTEKAEKIRDFVLHTDIASPFAEALMMNAARYLHFDEVIKPALARGAWVLSDRFIHSTFAYQLEVGLDKLKQLHSLTADNLYPDLTFILDISPEAARQGGISKIGAMMFTRRVIMILSKNCVRPILNLPAMMRRVM